MSRSYKKSPVWTDRKHGAKWWKRQANRKVRYNKDTVQGKNYRKMYCSWNIHDWISRESRADAIAWYHRTTHEERPYYKDWVLEKWPTLDDYLNKCWAHDHYRK